ncbi:hypothetical protein O6H91_13G102100 [Diphasiastrum complanatum]|uniref:Uncharacterized protein n=1 Tax=Diphasiastrum complanatum TaxID=34168 RepID=A0ACC2BXW8_DIPCM|nr:hypothetical protein O6H91_13G102100 [Diphasiastrum complanatum]
MVKPVLTCLQIESLHPLQDGGPLLSPHTSCLVSPRQASSCQALLHQPFSSLGTSVSWCTSPLYKSSPHISPSTFTARAAASDHMQLQAASVPNFYQVLGLADDVALPDIKAAYRQMARKYHPDVCPDPEVEESTRRFLEVQAAYETLSDPDRRASYDRTVAGLSSGARAAARWGWAGKEAQMDWKLHWEDQLLNMMQTNAARAAQSHTSWGARMRRQYQQQQEHEYAGF